MGRIRFNEWKWCSKDMGGTNNVGKTFGLWGEVGKQVQVAYLEDIHMEHHICS